MREFLKDVWMHGGEESRAITPENITGDSRAHAGAAFRLFIRGKLQSAALCQKLDCI